MIQAYFSLDGGKYFAGIYNPSIHWNGWYCPLFDLQTAIEILGYTFQRWTYNSNTLTFTYEDTHDTGIETVQGTEIDGDVWYSIGSHAWVWGIKH